MVLLLELPSIGTVVADFLAKDDQPTGRSDLC